MTYGDYFTAAQHFLLQDNLSPLIDAAGRMADRAVALSDIGSISVYLVKHGAFYHPGYVTVDVRGRRLPFVLNVAASTEGRKIIAREYGSLSRLNAELAAPFWPRVYGMGQGADLSGRPVPMFLGQWLYGFYEFHLTGEHSNRRRVEVWDTQGGRRELNHEQTVECLGQAASILAYAYNPLTFEAVRQWHHAAGDFVIALDGDDIDLRLITVRNYAPMIENPDPDVASILEALLVFLVETSLKLRLDRLDGVGSMVCYSDDVVPAICRGFFQGLRMAAPARDLPEDFDGTVREFIALHGSDQLTSIAAAIIDKVPFNSEEQDLLQRILQSHVSALISALAA